MSALGEGAGTAHVPEPGAWRAIRHLIAASWQTNRIAFVFSLFETVGRVLDALTPLFVGMLIHGVVTHSLRSIVAGGLGVAAARGVQFALMTEGVRARIDISDQMAHRFQARMGELSGQITTVDHLTDPVYRDRMQTLTENRSGLGRAFNLFVNVLNNGITPLVTFAVAWTADPRLLLLLVVAVPSLYAVKFSTRWDAAGEAASATPGRLSAHLMEVLTSAGPASELRVMGARGPMAQRADHVVRQWRSPITRATTKSSLLAASISAIYLLAAAAMIIWLTRDALAGHLSAGRLATAILVVGAFRDSVESISWTLWGAARMVRNSKRFLWLEDLASADAQRHRGTGVVPQPLREGIRLEDVTFTYPGADSPTFQRFSLHLPAGATIAVVGENGAGKSTLVSLLTGMHDVDSGTITVDGQPLASLELPAWRRQCSGAFQDHLRLETSVREAIGVGDLSVQATDKRVVAALERAAATDVLTALPRGLDTPLGPDWPGGVGLSGGQWQRLAIARAMMRPRPLLLVLDEPTSALDPATEHRLFDGYAQAARRTRDNGGITVLVTHRFSTVAAADLVVVLDRGTVSEMGTHTELMAAAGAYARLFELQAAGYRD